MPIWAAIEDNYLLVACCDVWQGTAGHRQLDCGWIPLLHYAFFYRLTTGKIRYESERFAAW